jgi:hypothetical protein
MQLHGDITEFGARVGVLVYPPTWTAIDLTSSAPTASTLIGRFARANIAA